MSLPGRAGRVLRGLGGLGRVVLLLGLLGALWFGTVKGVDRGSREADSRREEDRAALAAGFASAISDWVDAGRQEATDLGRRVGAGTGPSAQAAVQTFFTQPRTFTRSAVIFGGSRVTSASPDRAVLVGRDPQPCKRIVRGSDAEGRQDNVVIDNDLDEIVAKARSSGAPVVSRLFDVPGPRCEPGVAVAAPAGGAVAVVIGDLEDARARVSAGTGAGMRVRLVTGDVALDPEVTDLVATPARLKKLAAEAKAAKEPRRGRYGIEEASTAEDAQVVAAVAPAGGDWSIALEQDAAVFDIELQNRPSVIVATVLVVVFAIVFLLLAYFDSRRRREQRRSEVAKNAFFSIAGHELRTPLTSLKGFAEMLSVNWDDLDEERRRMLVDRMAPQTRRLDRLVERLLVGASMQADTHTRPQIRDVDPVAALQQVAGQFRDEAPLHEFVVKRGKDVRPVLADPRALDQVLQHLVENAVKYSPAGGRVWLKAAGNGRYVHLVVEDEGVGLPSDHRQIFDKFVQGESVMKRVHDEGGVGLGLYIVKTLVEDMGGVVRAEQRSPDGARFVVSLRPAETPPRNGSRRQAITVPDTGIDDPRTD